MKQIQKPSARAHRYTFGVEIECHVPNAVINREYVQIARYHSGGGQLPDSKFPWFQGKPWRAEADASLRAPAGYTSLEVVSPILYGQEGIDSLMAVCKTLNDWGAKVGGGAAIHVHVGVGSVAGHDSNRQADFIAKLLHLVAHNEMALYAITGSRARATTSYCESINGNRQYRNASQTETIAKAVRRAKKDSKGARLERRLRYEGPSRYHSINIVNILSPYKRTVEFRIFSGSTNGQKITAWVQVCLALCERAWEAKKYVAWERPQLSHVNLQDPLALLNRLFYSLGWTKGRKDVGQEELRVLGLITNLAELKKYKKELRRLARKFKSGN